MAGRSGEPVLPWPRGRTLSTDPLTVRLARPSVLSTCRPAVLVMWPGPGAKNKNRTRTREHQTVIGTFIRTICPSNEQQHPPEFNWEELGCVDLFSLVNGCASHRWRCGAMPWNVRTAPEWTNKLEFLSPLDIPRGVHSHATTTRQLKSTGPLTAVTSRGARTAMACPPTCATHRPHCRSRCCSRCSSVARRRRRWPDASVSIHASAVKQWPCDSPHDLPASTRASRPLSYHRHPTSYPSSTLRCSRRKVPSWPPWPPREHHWDYRASSTARPARACGTS
jgi:hypothetical protein